MTQEDNLDKIDQAIFAGAKTIARWLQVPGGGASFEDAVVEHFVWFQAARARGMDPKAIVNVLYTAGIRRKNGQPLSKDHLRGVLSRQQRKKIPGKQASLQALMKIYGPKAIIGKREGSAERSKRTAGKSHTLSPAAITAQSRLPAERTGRSAQKQGTRLGNRTAPKGNISDPYGIRDRMKQAEALRRKAEED